MKDIGNPTYGGSQIVVAHGGLTFAGNMPCIDSRQKLPHSIHSLQLVHHNT